MALLSRLLDNMKQTTDKTMLAEDIALQETFINTRQKSTMKALVTKHNRKANAVEYTSFVCTSRIAGSDSCPYTAISKAHFNARTLSEGAVSLSKLMIFVVGDVII